MKRYMPHVTRQQGFVVLTTVIILSVVLILIAQALSTAGYFQRRGLLDFQFKELSYWVARSCADRAVFKLTGDLDYAGNETAIIGSYQCEIGSVTQDGANSVVHVVGTAESTLTKLKIVADSDGNIISFSEE